MSNEDEPKAGEAFIALADSRLLDAIERRARRIDRKPREIKSPVPPKTHLDPADWRAGYLV
jgi:hypothetical protein